VLKIFILQHFKVVFESIPEDETKLWDWLRIPINLPQKRPGQYWINFGYDNPDHFTLLNEPGYMVHFDLNMTYNQQNTKSNIPISLFCNWSGGNINDLLLDPPQKTNDKLVAIVLNKCSNGRGKKTVVYVKELMNYISVDSYGECLHNMKQDPVTWTNPEDHGEIMKKEIEIYSRYKFVLSFEINNLTDFVTERVLLPLKAGAVPVYMGAPNIDDWLPGDSSIIKTSDFENPKALAVYLKELNEDNQKYSKYFNWKKKGISNNFLEKVKQCLFYGADCRLCQRIADLQSSETDMSHGNNVQLQKSFSLSFDGQTNFVDIGDYPELRIEDEYTISAWIYIESMEDFRIVDKNSAGRVDGYSLDIIRKGTRGFLRFCSSGGCWMGMRPLTKGNWYHVAIIFVSSFSQHFKSGIDFFINGEFDYHAYLPQNIFGIKPTEQNNLPLRFGRAGYGGSFWHGFIDDVSIWSIPLSNDRIRRLMYERLGGNEIGLIGYWSFNEGEGNIVYDYSKNRRHGTIYGDQLNWIPSETKELILNSCV